MPFPTIVESQKYAKRERSFNRKIGDIVHIFRRANSHEGGWLCSWVSEMDVTEGKYGIIVETGDDQGAGIKIRTDDGEFYYPYTCLRIIR